jgi:hypothetical protein
VPWRAGREGVGRRRGIATISALVNCACSRVDQLGRGVSGLKLSTQSVSLCFISYLSAHHSTVQSSDFILITFLVILCLDLLKLIINSSLYFIAPRINRKTQFSHDDYSVSPWTTGHHSIFFMLCHNMLRDTPNYFIRNLVNPG